MNKDTNKKRIFFLLLSLTLILICPASAAGIMDSQFFTGTQKLVNDITSALTVICPLVAGGAVVYFFIRRGMADEQDGKMWNRRIMVAVVCGVAGTLASALISVATSYYK